MSTVRTPGLFATVAMVALCAALASGCGGGGKTASTATATNRTMFDPANFGNPATGANLWDPLKPGRQSVREGRVNRGHRRLVHRRVYTVTNVSRRIDGVRTVVILDQDFDGGQIAEQALDYLAEDRSGNVWYLGSYTESYEGGQFVNASDAWLAGVKRSGPGILLPAQPRKGMYFFESRALGRARDPAQIVKTGQAKCVPFKCYSNVVVVQEGGGSGAGAEWKYYAPGVGGILTEPRYKGGEQETELMINATQLSPRGLAEISAEALKVDRHASVTKPDVFGGAPPAQRAL